MKKIKKYFWNLLIAIDQLFNAFFGGDPDETISSRTGKLRHKRKWARWLSDFLNLFEKDHTKKSIEEDEGDDRTVE